MRFVKRGGKAVMKAGKLVTNNECCCDTCLEDCVDATISVTLPSFTGTATDPLAVPDLAVPILGIPKLAVPRSVGCDCTEAEPGPFTLTAYTPASPVAGCCYWRNLAPGGVDDCSLTSVYAEMCIVDETVTLTVTANYAGGVTHTFSHEFVKCDFCASMPGFVSLEGTGGDCDTEGVADVTFASSCCHPPSCNCSCGVDAETLYFDWVTEPPVDCPLMDCFASELLPPLPWALTRTLAGSTLSVWEYNFSDDPEWEGPVGYVSLRCNRNTGLTDCDCDVEFWEECLWTLELGCVNGCILSASKCLATLPTAGFPMTFSSADTCTTDCSDDCLPWEASISE